MYYNTNDYRDYLAHHGVLGQKWGKKNGPPYPLAYGDHSASEKKAGWMDSLEKRKKYKQLKRAGKSLGGYSNAKVFRTSEFKENIQKASEKARDVLDAGYRVDKSLYDLCKDEKNVKKAGEKVADAMIKHYGYDRQDNDDAEEMKDLIRMEYDDAVSTIVNRDGNYPHGSTNSIRMPYTHETVQIYEQILSQSTPKVSECNRLIDRQCEAIKKYFDTTRELSDRALGEYADESVSRLLNDRKQISAGDAYMSTLNKRTIDSFDVAEQKKYSENDFEHCMYNHLIYERFKKKYGDNAFSYNKRGKGTIY